MKFSRLRLTGFKSFTDPTDLHLEPGLTGIVGPNGCGKSNLVEAMRWVMGESSYKNMRASGMDDVIFSGSANRPARNSAEVTLFLDNKDRTAPAVLNHEDELEVTRRIEREHGSVYRVNGKEVRARDVQLLFADASTGARSPAMVRQGQIGELISAKPKQRRLILEEAAGISGLHSRRHEAELRLRAAESNLERVDDIIANVETQLENLKRQARQATRYRNISGDIRRAEATLLHLRWVAVKVKEKETEAEHARLVNLLADATHLDLAAKKRLEQSEEQLQPLRQKEAEAAATLQRIRIALTQLEEDAKRANQRKTELEGRLVQVKVDAARDTDLISESRELIANLAEEESQLNKDAASASDDNTQAQQDAERTKVAVQEAESALRSKSDKLSEIRAHKSSTQRTLDDAKTRLEKLNQQLADVADEAQKIIRALSEDKTLQARQEALAAARTEAERAEQDADKAEAATRQAEQDLSEARPALTSIEAEITKLDAEAQAIGKMLELHDQSLWPAIVDALEVEPGFETALGAAIGDDLDASSDDAAPLFWSQPGDHSNDAPLPAGADALSSFVKGPALLTRRLNQIGVVAHADGERLMRELKPGQTLVTKDGELWRWDGFVARGDAPTAAAQRLAQRNRLADIDAERRAFASKQESIRADVQAKSEKLAASREQERQCRDIYKDAQRAISAAQAAVEAAQKGLVDLTSRRSALEEAQIRLKSSRDDVVLVVEDAQNALVAIEDDQDLARTIEAENMQLSRLREQADLARLRLAGFENAARMREQRLARIASERSSWQKRLTDAETHLASLVSRQQEIETQLEDLNSAPDQFADQRRALEDKIDDAEQTRKRAADAVATAEQMHREQDRDARDAIAALSKVREEIARIEERLKSLGQQRLQIEQNVVETLNVSANRTAEIAGIKPEQQLPNEAAIEAKLERLKRERERLGGVNLRAEQESTEVGEKLETMIADREDLIAAIAKLRTGISNLNREGRARLTEAFDKVNAHFKELFTQLFGGGDAELTFVESDDPLEAGLEIIARPPGKKPQTMTLLSGGEQALTAMSLIFAVFLTNPAPICVLDEVDAPLDDANVERFCNLLDSMREKTETRFVVITHNPITMARMDRLFGVTMAERGISNLVSVDLTTAETFLEAS
ncbi:chromosome segregation protein SMC [Maritalea porphyrae]|uniref:Chromosome partition protein Smc n=1 Tax=Maritalea porphyrae TaxID=880732 RepID=A0ABQ5USV3_9HYPH|nr:chromosome segregation protein SMC [Maritalea porphyrae]GLQ17747.1 chromosome partition protein Smc [Maritalea porphyrae]